MSSHSRSRSQLPRWGGHFWRNKSFVIVAAAGRSLCAIR
jgi:hypothetical protein